MEKRRREVGPWDPSRLLKGNLEPIEKFRSQSTMQKKKKKKGQSVLFLWRLACERKIKFAETQ